MTTQHNPLWTLVVASFGVLMTFLDALVVTTALPALRIALHGNIADLEWTVNAYNLAFACLLLTGAALGDRFGRRRILCIGLAIFTAASATAALSPNIQVLIVARAVQGAGGALVMPLTLTLISTAFPVERRGWAIGVWGAVGGLSGAIGPFVGGVIVQSIGWHWVFWLNVPIGLTLLPIALLRVNESFGGRPRLDVIGLILAGIGLCGITWGLVSTATAGWVSAEVIGTLFAGAVILGVFLWWEQRSTSPMLSLRMFTQPRFAVASCVSFFLYAALFGALFLMSQFFQSAQGHSPAQTGARLLVWSAPGLVAMPIVGKLATRFGNRRFMVAGLVLQAGGLGWVALIAGQHVPFAQLCAPLVIAGIGASLVFPTVAAEVVSSVPAADIGIASGTNSALRELGGVFGVAVLAAVFARPDVYRSPDAFGAGFGAALWVGASFSAAGALIALAVKSTPRESAAHKPIVSAGTP
jgi:EmrB/QacA subfamily drug resistance transporter